jgi:hypothetical protein
MSNLSAEVLRIRDVFSSAADLKVPPYQRSFSWTTKEVDELVFDLIEAFESQQIYFLGAMVVIQNRQRGPQDVVDGQQRLTTLTMMLAVLRDLARSDDEASVIQELIGQRAPWPASGFRWRLSLNHLDVEFFRQWVQTRGATLNVSAMLEAATTQSQRSLAIAVRRIHDEFSSEMSEEERTRFFRWLSEEVSIVRVKVGEYNLGYKVFLVLNRRGIPLADHDILKSALFQRASFLPHESIHHSTLWHDYANRLGQQDFESMLKQVRFIYDPKMQGEFIDSLLRSIMARMTVASFLNSALPRFVDAYDAVMNGRGGYNLNASAQRSLTFLRSIHHESWRAPAIKFLADNPHDPDECARFFAALERLAYMLQYSVNDREYRARRYRRVMDAMDSGGLYEKASPLLLAADERQQFVTRLMGRFPNWKQRRALMMRISASVPGGVAIQPDADSTVEHILPKTPAKGSEWYEEWAQAKDREELTECIGNFTLLTEAENQEADRKPFLGKLAVYFRNGPPSHALSLDLKGRTRWTPEDVRARREMLIGYLAAEWALTGK